MNLPAARGTLADCFDFGPDVLTNFIEGYQYTQPTYVSANLDYTAEPRLQALFDEGTLAFNSIVIYRDEYFGIIGVTTPNLPLISSPRDVVAMTNVAAIAQAEVDELEGLGVNKIILISHLQDITEDLALIGMLDRVDVVVAGGSDELLANPGDLLIPDGTTVYGPYPMITTDTDGSEVPVVTTRGNYEYVGRLVVGFDKDGNVIALDEELSGPVRVAGGNNPDAVTPDPLVQALAVDPMIAYIDNVGSNVFGVSAYDLDGLRTTVRSKEANEGNLIADALLWQATQLASSFGVSAPDVALQNGGGIRNNSIIPAGDITELDTFNMLPFPNFVSIVENIPRQQFKEILENAVGCTQPADFTTNPLCGSGRFAQLSGFTFQWSASGAGQILDLEGNVTVPGTRVQNVSLTDGTSLVSGGVVQPGPDLTVVTLDFLANGGDQYPFRGIPHTALDVTYQQALANYIQDDLDGSIGGADYVFDVNNRIFELP